MGRAFGPAHPLGRRLLHYTLQAFYDPPCCSQPFLCYPASGYPELGSKFSDAGRGQAAPLRACHLPPLATWRLVRPLQVALRAALLLPAPSHSIPTQNGAGLRPATPPQVIAHSAITRPGSKRGTAVLNSRLVDAKDVGGRRIVEIDAHFVLHRRNVGSPPNFGSSRPGCAMRSN